MLNKVTFTGIDNKTKIQDLINLYEKYPFIEFGFLISENNTNKNIDNKYPNLVILKGLKNKNINLSLHVCGKIAREIMQNNNWEPLYELMGDYLSLFSRIQLNVSNLEKFSSEVIFPNTHTFIIQTKTNNLKIYEQYKNIENVVFFQDNSGGTGKTENTWMLTDDKYFGYAGGLGSGNIVQVTKKITEIRELPFWIDMETKIRNDKNWFDIKECEKVCELLVKNNLIKF